jgi:hypothetical protein
LLKSSIGKVRLDLMADALRAQVPPQVIHHDLCEEAQWKLSALLPLALHERFRTFRDRDINLIMLGQYNRRGLTGLLHKGLAEQVARRTAVPVIAVWNSARVISDQPCVSDYLLWGSPGSDSFSSSLQKQGFYYSLILQGFDLRGNVAEFQTESLPPGVYA